MRTKKVTPCNLIIFLVIWIPGMFLPNYYAIRATALGTFCLIYFTVQYSKIHPEIASIFVILVFLEIPLPAPLK